MEDVLAKMMELLGGITKHDLQNCLEMWKHCVELYVNSEGNFFEDNCSSLF